MSPPSVSVRLLQSQSDRKLAALCSAGQEPAFEALVRRYRRELLGYCRRLGPRDLAPDDVVQQALLQAWQALTAGTEVRDVRSWLYRIVHNVAVSRLREAARLPEATEELRLSAGVEQIVEQRIAARAALSGLANLPERQRQVMVSTALDGRSQEEVAASLGLSSGSVRGLIYRARAKLRAAVAAAAPPPLITWALRRAEERPAALRGHELVAGGGGAAGLAGAVLKGGAVVSLAGALTGTTIAIVAVSTHRHVLVPGLAAPRHPRPPASSAAAGALVASGSQPHTIRVAQTHRQSAAEAGGGPGSVLTSGPRLAEPSSRTEIRGPVTGELRPPDSGPGGEKGSAGGENAGGAGGGDGGDSSTSGGEVSSSGSASGAEPPSAGAESSSSTDTTASSNTAATTLSNGHATDSTDGATASPSDGQTTSAAAGAAGES